MSNNSKKLNTTFLIDEELLKLYSNMTRNVGVDKILPYINLAQPFYIEPILGTALMVELQIQIDTDTLTDENKGLILKIAPALALWTDYLAARSLTYTVTQKGITLEESDNSRSINEKELAEFIHSIREQAEMATELLIKYLCQCQETYPLWKPSEECLCSKYQDNEGSAENHFKSLIYCPSGKPSGCPKCDYPDNIQRIR